MSQDETTVTPQLENIGHPKPATLQRVERATAILLSVIVVFLLVVQARHAGPLWRDECDSLQLARMPRSSDVLKNLQYTSFPVLFPALVRIYTTLCGTTDAALRLFGLLVGTALVGVAWFQAKTLNAEVPLVLPALIGLNTIFLTVGTSIRGYGIGSVLIVLAFTLTARVLLHPSVGNLAAVFIAYLASMQVLYLNGALVPAIILAATVVCYLSGRGKWALFLIGFGLVCAISYIPYLITIFTSTKEWAVVLRAPTSFGSMLHHLGSACGAPASIMPSAWCGILVLSAGAAVWRLMIIWRRKPATERDLILFAFLAVVTATVTYNAFLLVLHNTPNVRYFLALLFLVAAAVDLIIAKLSRFYWVRLARVVAVIAITVTLPLAGWSKIVERQSNIDIVAQRLQTESGPNDLIVINPWSLGTSFNRYYQGSTRWMTVPQLSEHRINRYDLLKDKMSSFFPLDDLEREMAATLRSGNRVWIVGGMKVPPPGRPALPILAAPDPQFGWESGMYAYAWSEQLGAFMQRHAPDVDLVIPKGKFINEHENVSLLAVKGWLN